MWSDAPGLEDELPDVPAQKYKDAGDAERDLCMLWAAWCKFHVGLILKVQLN